MLPINIDFFLIQIKSSIFTTIIHHIRCYHNYDGSFYCFYCCHVKNIYAVKWKIINPFAFHVYEKKPVPFNFFICNSKVSWRHKQLFLTPEFIPPGVILPTVKNYNAHYALNLLQHLSSKNFGGTFSYTSVRQEKRRHAIKLGETLTSIRYFYRG